MTSTPDRAAVRPGVLVAALAAGAAALAWTLRLPPGHEGFVPGTLLMAAIWTAGAVGGGGLRYAMPSRRAVESGVALGAIAGALLVAVFVLGAWGASAVPVLRTTIVEVLRSADGQSLVVVTLVTFLNGVAEELYFRGSLMTALDRWRPMWTTSLVYAAVTLASGNVLLALAALVLGLVTASLRRLTDGLVGPMLAHVTWSLSMLHILPPLLRSLG